LGEDVASLSYERALRAHARYKPAHRIGGSPIATEKSAITAGPETLTDTTDAKIRNIAAPEWSKDIAPDRDLRSASVTIRLSKTECVRLRERAAEAGLTISAYLRSCALEADALRAEVKKALAELKTAAETPTAAVQARKPWLAWMGRFTKH
jgi:predicted DNA binding CopG/RHH family protein